MGGWEGPELSTRNGQAYATGASASAMQNRLSPVALSLPPAPSPITSSCQLKGGLEGPASLTWLACPYSGGDGATYQLPQGSLVQTS